MSDEIQNQNQVEEQVPTAQLDDRATIVDLQQRLAASEQKTQQLHQEKQQLHEATIDAALQLAGHQSGAFNPWQISLFLRSKTRVEGGRVLVCLDGADHSPDAAMQVVKKTDHNLFLTQEQLKQPEPDNIDVRKLAKDPDLFRKVLKEKPEVLGLKRRNWRRK